MFSVLMSVYIKDDPLHLDQAIRSISVDQITPPKEIVIVEDGPITKDCKQVIENYKKLGLPKIKNIQLKKNVGLGNALNIGLKECGNEIVFRMDADDISLPNRFNIQYQEIVNRKCGALGCAIAEFTDPAAEKNLYRKVPLGDSEVKKFSRWRNPINHPSVVLRKSDVLSVGGYQDMKLFEDYFLWLRMLKRGIKINNLGTVLLKMRAGKAQNSRRSGLNYAIHEVRFLVTAAQLGLIPQPFALAGILLKTPIRLIPRPLVGLVYSQLLRAR
jgi:glycosyltransferase involved in cell wall biosynthesis